MASVQTPEQWVEHSAKMKAAWADPEKRKKLKERQESRWNDPAAKARQAEKMRAYHAARCIRTWRTFPGFGDDHTARDLLRHLPLNRDVASAADCFPCDQEQCDDGDDGDQWPKK
jgi:hypothetical protein